ncbi:MAG: hypothetical protein GX216_08850 [Methanomicrobiales archaeon]|nr:hypothetical protein [Methanomicrobiales archaeon]
MSRRHRKGDRAPPGASPRQWTGKGRAAPGVGSDRLALVIVVLPVQERLRDMGAGVTGLHERGCIPQESICWMRVEWCRTW